MGSDATPKWGINYPASSDPTNVPGDIQQPITEIDALLSPVIYGSLAGRSAPGKSGRWYFATDSGNYGLIFQDTGSNWVSVGAVNSTNNTGVGSAGLITPLAPGANAGQGGSLLSAAADHQHSSPGYGTNSDIKPDGPSPNGGSSGRFADAQHVHPGGNIGDVTWSLNPTPASNQVVGNGQSISQTTYPALFALSVSQGWPQNSPGLGNFNVIDLRDVGVVGAGLSYSLGTKYGSQTTTLVQANLPSHNHSVSSLAHSHGGVTNIENQGHTHNFPVTNILTQSGGVGDQNLASGPIHVDGITGLTTSAEQQNHNHNLNTDLTGAYVTSSVGSGTPVSNLSPVVALTPMIKAL